MSTQDRNSLPPEPPLSDAQFDAYLRRDSQVSQQYREQGGDGAPPPSLDRAVLSQAHAAASATKRSRMLRWSGPLALAASVVVVVSLVLEPTMQKEISESAVPAAPKPALLNESSDSAMRESLPQSRAMAPQEVESRRNEPQQVSSPALALDSLASEAERKATAKAEESRDQMANAARRAAAPPALAIEMPAYAAPTTAIRQTTSVAPPLPAPAPPRAADSAGGAAPTGERGAASAEEIAVAPRRRDQSSEAVGPRGTVSLSRVRQEAEEDASDKRIEQADPAAWLERIREMRRAERHTAADHEWRRFVKQYPDYVVDAADLARPPREP